MRREAGYDGVYGTIRLFDPDELAGAALFDVPKAARKPARARRPAMLPKSRRPSKPSRPWRRCSRRALTRSSTRSSPTTADRCSSWRDRARARPGCSRTRSRTGSAPGSPPERCLAVTFTRRARDELRDRLAALLGADAAARVTVATFHGLGLLILREQCRLLGLDADLKVADEKTRQEVLGSLSAGGSPAALGARIAESKRVRASTVAAAVFALSGDADSGDDFDDGDFDDGARFADPELDGLTARYDAALRERGMVDVDELVTRPVELLSSDARARRRLPGAVDGRVRR